MEYLKNRSEGFFREIRSIEIYEAADVAYKDNYDGNLPDTSKALYIIDINPESFSRKISTKTKSGNYYFDIDIGFPLLDLSPLRIGFFFTLFNKKGFAVVLNSNVEKLLLGNDREELTIDFLDGKKEDGTGTDECNFSITGETIIPPKFKIL